jgi:hypothetical protein
MQRTPIIVAGQVYLHPDLNEYLVVVKANQGEIKFKGRGISGVNDLEMFLERFGPVDPADLTTDEVQQLQGLLNSNVALSTGWVPHDEE